MNLVDREELSYLSKRLKAANKKIVSTNGCFDIVHVGHVRILRRARELGDVLVVGINSDGSVKRLKGEDRPLNREGDRAEVLGSLEFVDYVTIFDEDTPVEFLDILKPDIHVKGSDYKREDLQETPVVESNGGRIEIVDLVPGKSTSSLLDKIRSSDSN